MISEPGTAPTEKQKELFEELFLIIDFIPQIARSIVK
jgi:hypothetical protein